MIHAEVHLWGTRIGAVSLPREGDSAAVFEYDENFISAAKDIEPAPLKMKRRPGLFSFPEDSLRTFHRLPGLLVDSLPDKFGTSLLNRWFAETGRNPESLSIIERLLYMADRGMGALSYQPSRNFIEDSPIHELDMEDLGRLANMVLKRDTKLQLAGRRGQTALDLIRVGTSAGGARAKALVAEDSLGKFKPGHVIYPDPHRYWLLKFDGDSPDPPGMTTVEYIYSIIAKRCGINMPECRLLERYGQRHFMIERFDRKSDDSRTEKLHYASWCGIAHAHRDWPGAYGYEQLALTAHQLALPYTDMEEIFRRTVYNIVGVNNDDHTKNTGFLMSRRGEWRLSPAFDLTYAWDMKGKWTKGHQSSLGGKTVSHTIEDLKNFASHCDVSKRDAVQIIRTVRAAFAEWGALSAEYEVPKELTETITYKLNEISRHLDA
ncbi:MAG: type II toxin-antitoxin system HipA family toxin [Spirochaetes bacterium]|nr:MAG: type II toxin-antitoxin system HipA family toxin [Spirochaetota bacterium]